MRTHEKAERTITVITGAPPEVAPPTPTVKPTDEDLHPSTPGVPPKGQQQPQSMTPGA